MKRWLSSGCNAELANLIRCSSAILLVSQKGVQSLCKRFFLILIRGYQRFISPLFPPSCRYYPSCSSYMLEALKVHGTFKGLVMGIARILRCNPFAKGGIDYVPKEFSLKKNTVDQEKPIYSYKTH